MSTFDRIQSLPVEAVGVITALRERLGHILQGQMIGLYLSGSIAYGCFNPHLSDVDFTCVIKRPFTPGQRRRIRELFDELRERGRYGAVLEGIFPVQAEMNECQRSLVADRVQGGVFDPDRRYDKWPLERQELREAGVPLSGPTPTQLFAPSRWPMIRGTLLGELWSIAPIVKMRPSPLQRLQAVLNVCRVLYGLRYRRPTSKLTGLEWALRTFPEAWQDLLTHAHAIYTGLAILTPGSLNPDHVWTFYSWAVNTLPEDLQAQAPA